MQFSSSKGSQTKSCRLKTTDLALVSQISSEVTSLGLIVDYFQGIGSLNQKNIFVLSQVGMNKNIISSYCNDHHNNDDGVCLNVTDEDSGAGDETTGGGAPEEAGPG